MTYVLNLPFTYVHNYISDATFMYCSVFVPLPGYLDNGKRVLVHRYSKFSITIFRIQLTPYMFLVKQLFI